MAYSRQKQRGEVGGSCQEGWAKARGPRTGTGGLTSGRTDGRTRRAPSAPAGPQGEGPGQPARRFPPQPSSPSWRRPRSPGGGSGKEAAGGGTPAPRAASPPARGEPLGVTSSNRPGAGPSPGFERRESPTPSLQPAKGTPQPGPPPHPQPHGGSSTRLLAPRLPFRKSVSSLPPEQKLPAPSWSRAGARKGAWPPGAGPVWLRGNREREGGEAGRTGREGGTKERLEIVPWGAWLPAFLTRSVLPSQGPWQAL